VNLKIKNTAIKFIEILLKGIGQVMFQNNTLTGFLFLIGIFYNSWILGIGTILGVISSTVTAILLKYDSKDVQNGIYGFNGTLVGIALFYFFQINVILIVCLILGSSISSYIMNFLHKRKISPFTFPFVLTTWFLIVIILITKFTLKQPDNTLINVNNFNFLSSTSIGFGQVMFQNNVITGILFFIGILINSWRAALFALTGSIIGGLMSWLIGLPIESINLGLYGFNGVLCAIALFKNKKFDWLYAIFAIILSVSFMNSFIALGIIALTAPFVFSTWITLSIKQLIEQN